MNYKINKNLYFQDYLDNKIIYNLENGKISVFKNFKENTYLSFLEKLNFFSEDFRIKNFQNRFPEKIKLEQLYLIVTDDCNLNCKYCRQDKNIDVNYMTKFDVEKAIDTFFSSSNNLKSVVFYGGEPLLNKSAVFHAIEYIKSNYRNSNPEISIITNAILADKETANYLSLNNVNIIVSVDGPSYINDIARCDSLGKSHFKEIMNGYYNLKNSGCIVGTNTVIGPHNESKIDELVEWLIKISPNSVGFALPHGDRSNFAMDIRFSKIYEDIIKAYEKFRTVGISLIQVERKFKDIILNNVNSFECRGCKNRLVACPNGTFGICEGAVKNKNMFSLNLSDLQTFANEYQKTSPLIIEECDNCKSKRFCGGGCPYDKLMRYGNIQCIDPYRCGFMNQITIMSLNYICDFMLSKNEKNLDIINFDNDMREEMFKKLIFSNSKSIPLIYNCEAQTNK